MSYLCTSQLLPVLCFGTCSVESHRITQWWALWLTCGLLVSYNIWLLMSWIDSWTIAQKNKEAEADAKGEAVGRGRIYLCNIDLILFFLIFIQFLMVTLHLQLLQNIGYILCIVLHSCSLSYISLCLPVPQPYLAPHPTGNHSLFSVSMSLLLFSCIY